MLAWDMIARKFKTLTNQITEYKKPLHERRLALSLT